MVSEMSVFVRFPASCLMGVAPPVVRLPLSRLATWPRGAAPCAILRLAAHRAAPTERSRAGATRLSSQSQWSCWLLVSAVLGDSVLFGATSMEDMDLVIHMEIRSSRLPLIRLS